MSKDATNKNQVGLLLQKGFDLASVIMYLSEYRAKS